MIEKIEFNVSGQSNTNIYNREEYFLYLERRKKEYLGIHRVKNWIINDKKIEFKYKDGIPTFNWDGLAFIKDDFKTVVICNPDASVRFKIPVPEKLIQPEAYINNYELSSSGLKDVEDYSSHFVMSFERFDDYFEYEGKLYISLKVSKHYKKNHFDGFSQMRYLDCETGEFLPFTKKISRYLPNQYSYNEEFVDL